MYPCDEASWRLGFERGGSCQVTLGHDPLSPLSCLADRVESSRRWAPVLDRWHNHCEWLVRHHRQLRRRFRKTTAADRLSELLTTLRCTKERRREPKNSSSARHSESSRWYKINRETGVDIEFPELEPAKAWLGSVRPELIDCNLESGLGSDSTQQCTLRETTGDLASQLEVTLPDVTPVASGTLNADGNEVNLTETCDRFRKSNRPDDSDRFRTSTPCAAEVPESENEAPTSRRTTEWKEYVLYHEPILFRSYFETQFPKKSWRRAHQRMLTSRSRGRRNRSERLRKPPTPEALRVSWNSLNEVAEKDGFLRSPFRLEPVLPDDTTPNGQRDGDVEHENDGTKKTDDNHGTEMRAEDTVREGIQAIRQECEQQQKEMQSDKPSLDGATEDDALAVLQIEECEAPSVATLTEAESTVCDEGMIVDICDMVNADLNRNDFQSDGLLSDVGYEVLDDLALNPEYPPNFFRPGFADRATIATRRRRSAAVTRLAKNFESKPRAKTRLFQPIDTERVNASDFGRDSQTLATTHDSAEADSFAMKLEGLDEHTEMELCQNVVQSNITEDRNDPKKDLTNVNVEKTLESDSSGTVGRVGKLQDHGAVTSRPLTKVEAASKLRSDENDFQTSKLDKQLISGAVLGRESDQSNSKMAGSPNGARHPLLQRPISKGKANRLIPHNIPIVVGRRPWTPARDWELSNMDGDEHHQPWTPGAGDDDNGGVVTQRVPQLRRIEIQQGDAHVPTSSGNGQEEVIKATPKDVEGTPDVKRTGAVNGSNHDKVMKALQINTHRQQSITNERLAFLKQSYGNQPRNKSCVSITSSNANASHNENKTSSESLKGVTGNGVELKQNTLQKNEGNCPYTEAAEVTNCEAAVTNVPRCSASQCKPKVGNKTPIAIPVSKQQESSDASRPPRTTVSHTENSTKVAAGNPPNPAPVPQPLMGTPVNPTCGPVPFPPPLLPDPPCRQRLPTRLPLLQPTNQPQGGGNGPRKQGPRPFNAQTAWHQHQMAMHIAAQQQQHLYRQHHQQQLMIHQHMMRHPPPPLPGLQTLPRFPPPGGMPLNGPPGYRPMFPMNGHPPARM
ncbi:uncharacterized protein [Diadema setosum]|uniref:uncharacterized protein n=1 Tax=Diadema setosum TaxID=31175 RepID=UPI003B3B5184